MKHHAFMVALAVSCPNDHRHMCQPLLNAHLAVKASSTCLHVKPSENASAMKHVGKRIRGWSKYFLGDNDETINDFDEQHAMDYVNKNDLVGNNDERTIDTEEQRKLEDQLHQTSSAVDPETGEEVLVRTQTILDVVTRKPVQLSDEGPGQRLAQMFPDVPPQVHERHRLNWRSVEVPEMVERLWQSCSVKQADGTNYIPKHPSVTRDGVDFVVANRDLMGYSMKEALGRLTMKVASENNVLEAQRLQKLWTNFLTIENHVSAPFRQVVLDAEGRIGPNFGKIDFLQVCYGNLYERIGDYIVLKGMVAHWERKVIEAETLETNDSLTDDVLEFFQGDPRQYLSDPPELYSLLECTRVCAMTQKMCHMFVERPELFGDFPPEIVFFEKAWMLGDGSTIRKYMINEFCPQQGISPEGLLEKMRRLYQQMSNMQIDPYGELTNKLDDLCREIAKGTDHERDPYLPYAMSCGPHDPGFFQTYTFDRSQDSKIGFAASESVGWLSHSLGEPSVKEEWFDFGGLFQQLLGGSSSQGQQPEPKPGQQRAESNRIPRTRSLGRPHESGWLEILEDNTTSEETKGGMIIDNSEA